MKPKSCYVYAFITGRNEVVAKVMFLLVSVILFTGGGSSSAHARIPPPGKQTPPQRQAPPPPNSCFSTHFCCAKSSWCYLLHVYEDITHAMHFLSFSVQRADASRFQNGSILPGIFFTIMQNKHFNEARWKEQLIY